MKKLKDDMTGMLIMGKIKKIRLVLFWNSYFSVNILTFHSICDSLHTQP